METQKVKKFKKVVILDSVIFYPEHREILKSIAEEILEYPSSLPENIEKQYTENPELFREKKCYTQIAADNIPLQLLMNRVEGADVIISCWTNIPDEIIKLNPQLKLIIFWTHEKEHRLNMELVKKLGITVCNISDYGTDSVSELVYVGILELIKRNFNKSKSKTDLGITQEVFRKIFEKYRLYLKNEKETRRGQFLHHFHKLGMVKFDVRKDNLDEIIPEKLIENRTLGIIGKNTIFNSITKIAEDSFKMQIKRMNQINVEDANFYKFISESEIILLDSSDLNKEHLELVKNIGKDKIIDIAFLEESVYKLKDKVIGLIGLGRIATKVARMAKPFGLKVVYYSKTRKKELEEELGINYLKLDNLLKTSDIISIHLPAHKADDLLSKDKLDLIKEGTLFVNTADGNIIDQTYLTKLMTEKRIYAFLDVYPGLPRKDVLGLEMNNEKEWKIRENLPTHLLTYRAGWKTQESVRVKTYKLLGHMINYLIRGNKNEKS